MHLNFSWTTLQVLWTVKFAAMLVLLVVLLGKDRYKQFKFFTIGIVLVTFRLLATRLLYGKMAPIGMYEIFIPLADLLVVVNLLVLVEMARRAFVGLKQRAWILGTLVLLAVGAGVLAVWGPWPAWKTLSAGSTLAVLGLLQLASQKGDLLVNVLTVQLGLLVLLFGRRFKAGWRSHVQGILIGLSTVAAAQMLRDGIWELIARKAAVHSQEEYYRLVGLQEKLLNATDVVYAVVLVWWIACLWMDEPGKATAAPADVAMPEIPAAEEVPVPETNTDPEVPETQNDL
jgi:hypothetical protein